MKILVTYKSKTDFTKRYAEMIAEDVDGYLVEFGKITAEKMSEFDVVVYGGGLYAGMVNGFKKAKEMFHESSAKKLIVFATGGTPNEATKEIEEVWKNNLTVEEMASIPHFYMQSGICYEKMSFANRTLMKMMSNVLSKKKDKDSAEEGFAQAIKSSYDISSKEYAQPLIKLLLDGQFSKGFQYITLRDKPEIKDMAATWFQSKWGVPKEAYLECMDAYLNCETEYGWYLCLDGDKIVSGMGVIENDFHDRKDLSPNVCAVYTEEAYRSKGIAGVLLHMVVEDTKEKGITPIYLVTDHTGFYERYGWEFLCMVQGDGEENMTRMYIHR